MSRPGLFGYGMVRRALWSGRMSRGGNRWGEDRLGTARTGGVRKALRRGGSTWVWVPPGEHLGRARIGLHRQVAVRHALRKGSDRIGKVVLVAAWLVRARHRRAGTEEWIRPGMTWRDTASRGRAGTQAWLCSVKSGKAGQGPVRNGLC